MDLVAGGWVDARRDDAIEEVKNILRDVSMLDQVEEIWHHTVELALSRYALPSTEILLLP